MFFFLSFFLFGFGGKAVDVNLVLQGEWTAM
jgi:hypothetical protein